MKSMVDCLWRQDKKHALENALMIYRLFKEMATFDDFDEIVQNDMRETSTYVSCLRYITKIDICCFRHIQQM